MRCKGCGVEFSFDEAASKFNSHFDGYFDYAYNGWENYCADCAIDYAEDEKEEGNDRTSSCQSWCGNPAYPNCIDGCAVHGN